MGCTRVIAAVNGLLEVDSPTLISVFSLSYVHNMFEEMLPRGDFQTCVILILSTYSVMADNIVHRLSSCFFYYFIIEASKAYFSWTW